MDQSGVVYYLPSFEIFPTNFHGRFLGIIKGREELLGVIF